MRLEAATLQTGLQPCYLLFMVKVSMQKYLIYKFAYKERKRPNKIFLF